MLFADSMPGPTMFYPPPPTTEYFSHSRAHCVTYSPSPEPPATRPPLEQRKSRKRSRDQLEVDERQAALHQENTMDTSAPEPEPIYGEGMILLNPVTMRPIGNDASSSTGTWLESQLEEDRRAAALAAEQAVRDEEEMARAANRPSKASRLDMQSVRSGSPTTIPGLVAPAPLTPETPSAPGYDEAAMALGIGWSKVKDSTNTDLAAASRGWAKVIDNHFPVTGAEILAQNSSSYFVKACDATVGGDAWYLFNDKLIEGRMLSRNIDAAVANFQAGLFEGPSMVARVTPEPISQSQPMFVQPIQTEIAMEM